MKCTYPIKTIVASLMLGQLPLIHADTTLIGDHLISAQGTEMGSLEVEGFLSVQGNSIDLGTTYINTQEQPGTIWSYSETAGKPTVRLDTILAEATFAWGEVAGSGPLNKMILKGDNSLEIFAPGYASGTPDNGLIRVVPKLAASGGSSITINGQRVLTLADTELFVTQSSGHVSGNLHLVGSLTANGGTINLGDSPWGGMTAWGIALGDGAVASRNAGVALGVNNKAYGPNSLALGVAAQAHGYSSASIGFATIAATHFSFAAGRQTHTWAQGQFVVGANNLKDPDPNNPYDFDLSEAAFVVGNGSNQIPALLPNPPKSNAFVVRYNGNAEVTGNTIMKKSATVQENLTVGGSITAEKATFTGRVRVEPRGGISMGDYQYDPGQ
jgi:hypothetical protein